MPAERYVGSRSSCTSTSRPPLASSPIRRAFFRVFLLSTLQIPFTPSQDCLLSRSVSRLQHPPPIAWQNAWLALAMRTDLPCRWLRTGVPFFALDRYGSPSQCRVLALPPRPANSLRTGCTGCSRFAGFLVFCRTGTADRFNSPPSACSLQHPCSFDSMISCHNSTVPPDDLQTLILESHAILSSPHLQLSDQFIRNIP